MATSRLRRLLFVLAANAGLLILLLVPVELVFGTWIRPMRLSDIRRFSVPIDARFEFDPARLYDGVAGPIHYTRDQWGLRGGHRSLSAIDVLTIGGSTTEQRYLDDAATWQAVAERQLSALGRTTVIANAGVDGQSTVGHLFNFDFWFPLLTGLHPRLFVFYVGANDVMRRDDRPAFDGAVDATNWRVRSATFQLLRTVRNNLRARSVGVVHGRMRPLQESDFTAVGLLPEAHRQAVAERMSGGFIRNVDALRQRVVDRGGVPVFVTQTAFAWTGNASVPPRGVKETVPLDGVTANFADIAFLHQALNRALMQYCTDRRVVCFDLAHDVAFDAHDFYDYLHNTPSGAEKIGRYLATRLHGLEAGRGHDSP